MRRNGLSIRNRVLLLFSLPAFITVGVLFRRGTSLGDWSPVFPALVAIGLSALVAPVAVLLVGLVTRLPLFMVGLASLGASLAVGFIAVKADGGAQAGLNLFLAPVVALVAVGALAWLDKRLASPGP